MNTCVKQLGFCLKSRDEFDNIIAVVKNSTVFYHHDKINHIFVAPDFFVIATGDGYFE